MRIIKVGSRESRLAVAQATLIMDALRRLHPGIRTELLTMKTAGDRILDRSLEKIGGKGLFVKELDDALLAGRVDICVHSYKDMPIGDNLELPVLAVPAREDPRDVLALPNGVDILLPDRPIGTSSARRRLQAAALFPGFRCEPVRGNIPTRLRKLDGGDFGALILAMAGLKRLGMEKRANRIFLETEMLPSACQGALAVQGRAGCDHSFLDGMNDGDSFDACRAERAFVEGLDATCASPVAAHATLYGGELTLSGLYVDESGTFHRGERSGLRTDARAIGLALARELRRRDSEHA